MLIITEAANRATTPAMMSLTCAPDILTYSLSNGDDAELFTITGTVDNPGAGNPHDPDEDGVLSFKAAPDFENPEDDNGDNVYEVTINAINPTGKMGSVNVTVEVVDDPELAIWQMPAGMEAEHKVMYEENGDGEVFDYIAKDEDQNPGSPITYFLESGVDRALFEIHENDGILKFKASPNYEDPKDGDGDNEYEVTVSAKFEHPEGIPR